MGKSCVRFEKLDDLALDVIGNSIRCMWPAGSSITTNRPSRMNSANRGGRKAQPVPKQRNDERKAVK
jgi:hypothetical protein